MSNTVWKFNSNDWYYFVEHVVEYDTDDKWRGAYSSNYESAEKHAKELSKWLTPEEMRRAFEHCLTDFYAIKFEDVPSDLVERLGVLNNQETSPQTTSWECRAPFNSTVCGADNEPGYPCWKCGTRQ